MSSVGIRFAVGVVATKCLCHLVIDMPMAVVYFDDMLELCSECSFEYQLESKLFNETIHSNFLFIHFYGLHIKCDQFVKFVCQFSTFILPVDVDGIHVNGIVVLLLRPLLVVHRGRYLRDSIVPSIGV